MQRVDVHALDLSGLGPYSLHAGDPDRVIALERQQEPTVRPLKLGDSAQVMLHRPPDRQPEAVPFLKPVVAPGEVSELQPLDRVQVPGQRGLSDVCHVRKLSHPWKVLDETGLRAARM